VFRHRSKIEFLYQETGLSMDHGVLNSAVPRTNDREPGGSGFQKRDRCAFRISGWSGHRMLNENPSLLQGVADSGGVQRAGELDGTGNAQ
jgi:hypothetical protein